MPQGKGKLQKIFYRVCSKAASIAVVGSFSFNVVSVAAGARILLNVFFQPNVTVSLLQGVSNWNGDLDFSNSVADGTKRISPDESQQVRVFVPGWARSVRVKMSKAESPTNRILIANTEEEEVSDEFAALEEGDGSRKELLAVFRQPSVTVHPVPLDKALEQAGKERVRRQRAKEIEKASSLPSMTSPVPARRAVEATGLDTHFRGRVLEAFTGGQRPVEGVNIQVLGTQMNTQSGVDGEFAFEGIDVAGVLPVHLSKEGYLDRRIELRASSASSADDHLPVVELVHENSAALHAAFGSSKLNEGTAYLFGQLVDIHSLDLSGYSIKLISESEEVSPIYFDDAGRQEPKQAYTSKGGQFVALNLRPGTYMVVILDSAGVERAPHFVHVEAHEGMVRRFGLGTKTTIKGKLFNVAEESRHIAGAQVQLLGSEKQVITNRRGSFYLKDVFIDCFDLNYFQVEKAGFYRNRIELRCDDEGNKPEIKRTLFVASGSLIDGLAIDAGSTLTPETGIVYGHTGFSASVKMQLWGPQEKSGQQGFRGKDFYFDGDGILNGSRNRTGRNGNFLILDGPSGLSYVQALNKQGNVLSFWPILLSPSTVNVFVQ